MFTLQEQKINKKSKRERERAMEFRGNGGFQGDRRLLLPDAGKQAPIRAGLPNQMNQTSSNTGTGNGNESSVREQDLFMPTANVARIMRKILPANAKISDDCKETMQECVSEFISFVTSEANLRCQKEKRKTVTSDDLIWAMSDLGFDNYVEPLLMYLERYRQNEDAMFGLSRSVLQTGRAADPVPYGIPTSAPAFVADHPSLIQPDPAQTFSSAFEARYPGFFRAPGPINDPSAAGPSQPAKANFDPFRQAKE